MQKAGEILTGRKDDEDDEVDRRLSTPAPGRSAGRNLLGGPQRDQDVFPAIAAASGDRSGAFWIR